MQRQNEADLAGKVVIITGASRGVGKQNALDFAKRGAKVVLAARTVEPDSKLPGTIGETLAAVEALRKFDMFLHPLYRFVWQTDHANLQHLRDSKNARVQRWAMALGQYDFAVEHVPGILNVVADALSRVVDDSSLPDEARLDRVLVATRRSMATATPARSSTLHVTVGTDDAESGGAATEAAAVAPQAAVSAAAAVEDGRSEALHSGPLAVLTPLLRQIAEAQAGAPPAVLARWDAHDATRRLHLPDPEGGAPVELRCQGESALVPETAAAVIGALLYLAHDEGGHTGRDRTLARLREARVQWWGMPKAVDEYVAACSRCQHAKAPASPVATGKMAGVPIPAAPFDTLVMDYVGPLQQSTSGHCYILVIMDLFTRWV